MEESVKIAVRWRPIPGNDENNDKIILKKLTKNVSVNSCVILCEMEWRLVFSFQFFDKFINFNYWLDDWR